MLVTDVQQRCLQHAGDTTRRAKGTAAMTGGSAVTWWRRLGCGPGPAARLPQLGCSSATGQLGHLLSSRTRCSDGGDGGSTAPSSTKMRHRMRQAPLASRVTLLPFGLFSPCAASSTMQQAQRCTGQGNGWGVCCRRCKTTATFLEPAAADAHMQLQPARGAPKMPKLVTATTALVHSRRRFTPAAGCRVQGRGLLGRMGTATPQHAPTPCWTWNGMEKL